MRYALVILILLAWMPVSALAQTPTDGPDLTREEELLARDIGRSLRCTVCQNQSIEDSDADLAADLRLMVRERVAAGDDKDEVIAHVREAYGDFVLLKPPFQLNTWLLWLAPFAGLLAGFIWFARRSKTQPLADVSLSAEEEARFERLEAKLEDEP